LTDFRQTIFSVRINMIFFDYISLPRVVAIVLSFLLVSAFLWHIFVPRSDNHHSDTLRVVCTTTMITEAVKRIGGEFVTVEGLMGPGIDPHLYRVRAQTVELLHNADIIFYHGLHLEGKMVDTLQALSKIKRTVGVAEIIERDRLIESEFKGIYDPHVWHDPALWKIISYHIADQLSQYDPDHAVEYQQNVAKYVKEIDELDEYIYNELSRLSDSQRIIVTAHDAFAYFGKRYCVRVVALQGMNTDAQISPKDVTHLARFICDHKIATIFVESSIPRRTMEAVFQAVEGYGWHITIGDELFSDALGDDEGHSGSYCGMMRHNCDALIRGLQQQETV
jgi:manganese/zinc/iron transport system substrate-binding protein